MSADRTGPCPSCEDPDGLRQYVEFAYEPAFASADDQILHLVVAYRAECRACGWAHTTTLLSGDISKGAPQ